MSAAGLLGPAEVRAVAAELELRPARSLGQSFVVDANTVRRIVRLAGVTPADVVLEVGPGLGSLTLALLAAGARVVAVEVDGRLAARLPATVAERMPEAAGRLAVRHGDAARLTAAELPTPPGLLVANLPYNVAVPVLLQVLAEVGSVRAGLVMVQSEVADRLVAPPGGRAYGTPSVKLAWHAEARRVGGVPAAAFWPVPRVSSALVAVTRRPPPGSTELRDAVFALVDAAFGQRRKTLRAALARWAGSSDRAEAALRTAGIDPGARGEQLALTDYIRLASAPRP